MRLLACVTLALCCMMTSAAQNTSTTAAPITPMAVTTEVESACSGGHCGKYVEQYSKYVIPATADGDMQGYVKDVAMDGASIAAAGIVFFVIFLIWYDRCRLSQSQSHVENPISTLPRQRTRCTNARSLACRVAHHPCTANALHTSSLTCLLRAWRVPPGANEWFINTLLHITFNICRGCCMCCRCCPCGDPLDCLNDQKQPSAVRPASFHTHTCTTAFFNLVDFTAHPHHKTILCPPPPPPHTHSLSHCRHVNATQDECVDGCVVARAECR